MTNGHKPFEELAAGFEIDKFIMEVWKLGEDDYCFQMLSCSKNLLNFQMNSIVYWMHNMLP